MNAYFRVAILALLGVSFAATALVGAGCLVLAERSPRSEVARRVIEHEWDVGTPALPDPELLSERGQRLRRRGVRLLKLAAVLAVLSFALGWLLGPR